MHDIDALIRVIGAAEVGYDDPLYFSRLYTRFWGRSPSEERELVKPRR